MALRTHVWQRSPASSRSKWLRTCWPHQRCHAQKIQPEATKTAPGDQVTPSHVWPSPYAMGVPSWLARLKIETTKKILPQITAGWPLFEAFYAVFCGPKLVGGRRGRRNFQGWKKVVGLQKKGQHSEFAEATFPSAGNLTRNCQNGLFLDELTQRGIFCNSLGKSAWVLNLLRFTVPVRVSLDDHTKTCHTKRMEQTYLKKIRCAVEQKPADTEAVVPLAGCNHPLRQSLKENSGTFVERACSVKRGPNKWEKKSNEKWENIKLN